MTEKYKIENLVVILSVVKEKVKNLRLKMRLKEWHPNCWLIDVADEEIGALKFHSSVNIALYID